MNLCLPVIYTALQMLQQKLRLITAAFPGEPMWIVASISCSNVKWLALSMVFWCSSPSNSRFNMLSSLWTELFLDNSINPDVVQKIPVDQHFLKYSHQPVWHQHPYLVQSHWNHFLYDFTVLFYWCACFTHVMMSWHNDFSFCMSPNRLTELAC